MTPLLSAAFDYARRGWPVFPLWWATNGVCACPDARACDKNAAKHPLGEAAPHGCRNATTDIAVIEHWWTRWPAANVGIATGFGFDVLDVDNAFAADALDVLAELAGHDRSTCWGAGPVVRTAHGWHLLFEPTGATTATAMFGLKADWRGAGGYVVAPPSVHATGRPYSWDQLYGPSAPLSAAPGFLVGGLFPKATAQVVAMRGRTSGASDERRIGGLLSFVSDSVQGTRNDRLNWAVHALGVHVRDGRIDAHLGLAALDRFRDAAVGVGLSVIEVDRTITSAWKSAVKGAA